jgi:thiamine-monophosphate kinase
VSDGLSTDLTHICEESGVAAEIDAEAIPIHPLALRAELDGWVASALGLALHGGEDYELLFTAAKGTHIPRRIAGVEVHAIGRIVARSGRRPSILLRQRDGKTTALESGGWEHFSAQ